MSSCGYFLHLASDFLGSKDLSKAILSTTPVEELLAIEKTMAFSSDEQRQEWYKGLRKVLNEINVAKVGVACLWVLLYFLFMYFLWIFNCNAGRDGRYFYFLFWFIL